MMFFPQSLAIALVASIATAAPPSQLQQDVTAIQQLGVTGVRAEVATPTRTYAATAGFADPATKQPIRADTTFRAGSDTKTYVATVVLQLVSERRLRLTDTVQRWLPGLVAGNGNDGRRITVRHLLQHTSGLYDYVHDLPWRTADEFLKHRYDRYTLEQNVAIGMKHAPEFQPGDRYPDGSLKWSYSNTGYALLGLIIERATGQNWESQARDRIVRPLKLRHTILPGHGPALPTPHARGFQQFAPGAPLVDVTEMDVSWAGATGTIISTTADRNRFFQALLGGELLPPRMLAEMKRTVATHDDGAFEGSRYGLGLFWFPLRCDKAGYWGHGGDLPGFMTRGGTTTDGQRAISVTMATQLRPSKPQALAASTVIQNALCD